MNDPIKIRARRLLSKAGVHISKSRNIRPIDLSSARNVDPVAAVYQSDGRPVLLQAPLAHCRHLLLLAFPCTKESQSPFVETLIRYASGRCKSYPGSPLETFYLGFRPNCAAEVMGIDDPSYKCLVDVPPGGALFPWRGETTDEMISLNKQCVVSEGREHGHRLEGGDGDKFFGPVSERLGQFEFSRLVKIYDSMRGAGFKVDRYGFSNIVAICLTSRRHHATRYLVLSGHHRIAALSVLGYTYATLQIGYAGRNGIVRREDARYWPTVRAGYLTKEEALTIFDRIFDGEQPESFLTSGALLPNPTR